MSHIEILSSKVYKWTKLKDRTATATTATTTTTTTTTTTAAAATSSTFLVASIEQQFMSSSKVIEVRTKLSVIIEFVFVMKQKIT